MFVAHDASRLPNRFALAINLVLMTFLCGLLTPAHADTAKEHFDRAMAFYKEKHYEAALAELEVARKLAPEDDGILNWVGWIYLSEGQFSEARPPLEHAIKIRPTSVDAHLNLGNVYDGLKMYPEAVREFEAITKLRPSYADAYYNLGSVYYKMHRSTEAIDAYRKSTRFRPDDPYNWNGLGYVYQSIGRNSDAMIAYGRAAKLSAGKSESVTFLLNYSLAALAVAGKTAQLPGITARLKSDNAYDSARTALIQAIKLRPEDYQIHETYAETLFDLGKFADSIPEFEHAAQIAQRDRASSSPAGATAAAPNLYDPYYNIGVASEKIGRLPQAVEAYQHAVEFAAPDSHVALMRLGEIHYRLAQYDDAVKCFTQITRVEPENLNGWLDLASALHMKGDAEAETIILEEAVSKHHGEASKMAQLRCALAFRYYQKAVDPAAADPESLAHASEQYNDALKLTPTMPDALNGMGLIALRQGKPDDAIVKFKQAIASKPNFADAYNNLGVAYRAKGNLVQARAYFARALQINPNNKLAKDNLASVAERGKP